MRVGVIGLGVALASLWACGDAPSPVQTPTSAAPPTARADFMNGPATLPNLVRFFGSESGFGLSIYDQVSGLTVYLDWTCTGQPVPVDYQQVGLLRNALHQLAMQKVPVLVYRGPHSVCVTPPLASGTGRLMYLDSDYNQTGNGARVVSLSLTGQVDLAAGGQALLSLQLSSVVKDGTRLRDDFYVRLGPAS